jgi:sulfur carrier protein
MKITINHNLEFFNENNLSVSEILKIKNFSFKLLVVRLNGKLIKKEERDSTLLNDGDDLQVIHLISGG